MIVSLFMFGVNSSRTYTSKKVRQKQPVGLKKKRQKCSDVAKNQSLTDTACFPQFRTKKPWRKRKEQTHTTAFYPKESVTIKSLQSEPHSGS